jgi:hypothetical protein
MRLLQFLLRRRTRRGHGYRESSVLELKPVGKNCRINRVEELFIMIIFFACAFAWIAGARGLYILKEDAPHERSGIVHGVFV